MAFTIVEKTAKPGPTMFYDPGFRHILETHMNQLRTIYAIRKELKPEKIYQFEGDFNGFLLSESYGLEMHWLMMRINGMTNPNQFGKELREPLQKGSKQYYIEPHPDAISELQMFWITLKK